MPSRLSAVIVAFRSREELPACLAGLANVAGLDEIVVVDHGDDGSAEIGAALGANVLRDTSNPGYGTGQNRGIERTTGDYVLLVNPDAVVVPASVATAVEFLESNPDVAAVQGVIRNQATSQPERSQGVELGPLHLLGRALGARRLLRFPFARQFVRGLPRLADHVERIPSHPNDVQSLAATALLVRRQAFDEVGGFDEGYFLYSEDLDLCRRLRLAGWRLVALPLPWADHRSGASSAGWWSRELVWWEGTLRYAAKWWSGSGWAAARVATIVRILPMVVSQPRRSGEIVARLLLAPGAQRKARRART